MRRIIVGSRESKLALAQSMEVVSYLRQTLPDTEVALQCVKTTGDQILDRTLEQIGGKGLFVKELDAALREGRIDLAVHSLKDVPMEVMEDIPLIGFSKREDPRDVLVLPVGNAENMENAGESAKQENPGIFPPSAKKPDAIPDPALPIGSASLRRQIQLEKLYPGCHVSPVRGNVQTRLRKLDEGQYGALVLAAAGLRRLGLAARISRSFSIEEMLPAAGQGILALQGRAGEDYAYLSGYLDPDAAFSAICERAFTKELDGGCTSPSCAYAEIRKGHIRLRGLYYDENRRQYRIGESEGDAKNAADIGSRLADALRRGSTGKGSRCCVYTRS